eukprot:scaffold294821_cov37-Prasinocladus_malaysianus.AAC.1
MQGSLLKHISTSSTARTMIELSHALMLAMPEQPTKPAQTVKLWRHCVLQNIKSSLRSILIRGNCLLVLASAPTDNRGSKAGKAKPAKQRVQRSSDLGRHPHEHEALASAVHYDAEERPDGRGDAEGRDDVEGVVVLLDPRLEVHAEHAPHGRDDGEDQGQSGEDDLQGDELVPPRVQLDVDEVLSVVDALLQNKHEHQMLRLRAHGSTLQKTHDKMPLARQQFLLKVRYGNIYTIACDICIMR